MTGGAAIATSCSGVSTVARAGRTNPSVRCLTAARSVPQPVTPWLSENFLNGVSPSSRDGSIVTTTGAPGCRAGLRRDDGHRLGARSAGGEEAGEPECEPAGHRRDDQAALQVVLSGTAGLSARGAGAATFCPNEFR